ncbi:MAG: hypothetical protein R3Y54_10990 [Eubacteriales bacterium]
MKVASWNEFQHLMLLQVADEKAHVQTLHIREKIEIATALVGGEGEILYQRR